MIRRLRRAADLASAFLVGAAAELSWRTRALRAEATHASLREQVERLESDLIAHLTSERDAVGVDVDACTESEALRNGIEEIALSLEGVNDRLDGLDRYAIGRCLRDLIDKPSKR